jgi:hypothetical protein
MRARCGRKQKLQRKTNQVEYELRNLEKLRNQIQQALQTEEIHFNNKLAELTKLKDRKPELFIITAEE